MSGLPGNPMTVTAPAPMVVEALSRRLLADRLVVDPDVVRSLSHDEAEWARVGAAAAVVRARSEDDVAHVVRTCAELGVAVIPRGAGTGLSGGANAVDGCVVLDLSRMQRIVEMDVDNLVAVVQPGVVNDDLKAAAAEHGLWYPPDPASARWSTLGGNVATNAGGLCCVKYGVTKDYVLGMRAVMGGAAGYGTAVALGRRTVKGVAGYDLAGLMVGSEGTLGVVTEITLRLRPAPMATPRTIVGAFPTLVSAGRAVAEVTRRRLVPSALELLDRACLEAVEDWKHLGLEADAEVLLLAREDTPGPAGDDIAQLIADALTEGGAMWAARSTDDAEADALFEARRLAYPALERLGPVLTEDICVPRSRVPDMLAATSEIATRRGVRITTIAHAGDGNLHPLLLAPPGDDAARSAAQQAFDDLIDAAIGFGGTVTGEHGVGLLKLGGVERELQAENLGLQRSIKATLDPLDIFNPTKALP